MRNALYHSFIAEHALLKTIKPKQMHSTNYAHSPRAADQITSNRELITQGVLAGRGQRQYATHVCAYARTP